MRFCDSLGLVFLKQENPPAALTRLKFENLNLQISFNRKYRRFCAHCRATRLQIKKRILITNLVCAGLVQIAAGCWLQASLEQATRPFFENRDVWAVRLL